MMMKNIFTLVLFSGYAYMLSAQTTFQKTYGGGNDESMFGLAKTNDGGYVMAGSSLSFLNNYGHSYIIKTDYSGNLLWSKLYFGVTAEGLNSVSETSDHGLIVSGGCLGFGAGAVDGLLMKTDSLGTIIWAKVYGGPGDDGFNSCVQTFDGGYIATGFTNSSGAGSYDILVVRLNSSGDTLWTRIFGGAGWDNAQSIIQTGNNHFVLCGRTASFSNGLFNNYLIKLDANGNMVWNVQYGGNLQEESWSLKELYDNGYIVIGSTESFGSNLYDAYLNRFNSSGNLVWSKIYGGPKIEAFYDVVTMTDSGFAFTGYTDSFGDGHRGDDSSNILLIRTDKFGDTLWTRTFGSDKTEEEFALVKTDDEGLALMSYSSSFGTDSLDVYLIKTDASGNSHCNETPANPFFATVPTVASVTVPQITRGISVSPAVFTTINPPTFEHVQCFIDGVAEYQFAEEGLSLFPNPVGNELAVGSLQFAISEVEIYNVMGEKTGNWKLEIGKNKIDVSILEEGIYFVMVTDEKNNRVVRKIVKM